MPPKFDPTEVKQGTLRIFAKKLPANILFRFCFFFWLTNNLTNCVARNEIYVKTVDIFMQKPTTIAWTLAMLQFYECIKI